MDNKIKSLEEAVISYSSTPRSVLLEYLMNSDVSKTEREWCARNEIAALTKALKSVEQLINESRGVYGLHLNGNQAPWDELRMGGQYEGWLFDLDKALERIKTYEKYIQ